MNKLPETAHWLWRVPLAGAAYALGAMLVGGLMQASGAPLPSPPVPPEPARDIVLLFVAGMVMALALAAMGAGIAGRWWQRWGLLTAFVLVVYGVGNALEGSIFTTLGGQWSLMWINVAAGTLCALAVSLGGGGAPQGNLGESLSAFRRKWLPGALLWRIGLAILAFPFFYFLFGMLIAPIVVPHYAQLDFLTIPPMPVMLQVLFVRSALFLIVSLPIVAAWRRSRVALVIALGLGHFVAVGFAGLIQASFFPAVLRWTHSLEILADSMFYAWALTWLFVPRGQAEPGGQGAEEIERAEPFAYKMEEVMNKKLKRSLLLAGKVLVLTLLLVVLSGVGSTLLPATAVGGEAEGGSNAPAVPSLSLVLTIMFLQVVALAIPIVRSRWHGWGLACAIFVLYFGTVTFMSQIESLVYLGGKMPEGLTSGLFAMGLFVAAVFSPVAVLTLGKWRAAPANGRVSSKGSVPRLDFGRWGWRIGAAGALFLALYYLFGYYIAWQDPELRAYYGGTDPGSFLAQMESVVRATAWMLPLQFARGLLWVGLGLLLIRAMRGPWWHAGLATALLFAVPSLYLLFPNPVMPDFPRMTHLIETLPYQFLFGWFLAWFFRDRKPTTVRSAASVAA